MRFMFLLLIFHTVWSENDFGTPYLKGTVICLKWSCINSKLGFSDNLPTRENAIRVLKSLLPVGSWQDIAQSVVDVCYENRPRRYTNTCPGQALMHCVMDQLTEKCPDEYWVKKDVCAPVSSLAGLNYMFSQSLYEDYEINMPLERRPSWFLTNYFSSKCCALPNIFAQKTLKECGFNVMMKYFPHASHHIIAPFVAKMSMPTTTVATDRVEIVNITNISEESKLVPSTTVPADVVQVVTLPNIPEDDNAPMDPLDCCNLSEFVKPGWRTECGLSMGWEAQDRLTINNELKQTTEAPTTTLKPRKQSSNFVILPQSCDKEICVFKKLNIINENGVVDIDAFSKFLDNITTVQPLWSRGKAKVEATCLKRPLTEYEADCEINKILACTFDVLTENCPYIKKSDSCRHMKNSTLCQISTSKHRPKNRRDACTLPDMLLHTDAVTMSQCGVSSLIRVESTFEAPILRLTKKKGYRVVPKYTCHDLTPTTTCVLDKMGVMNKYGFMDYFKMKDRIRDFTTRSEWSAFRDVYLSAFTNTPMYLDHCNSPKKFLNVIDSMLMTCPISRRKSTAKCSKMFSEAVSSKPMSSKHNLTSKALEEIFKHFHKVFVNRPNTFNPVKVIKKHSRIVSNPTYTFGILNSNNAPKVKIIDLKPKSIRVKKPLTIFPVYLRQANIFGNNNKLQSTPTPFWLHNKIASFHTTPSSVSPPYVNPSNEPVILRTPPIITRSGLPLDIVTP